MDPDEWRKQFSSRTRRPRQGSISGTEQRTMHSVTHGIDDLREVHGHSRCVNSIAFSADGQLIITGGSDNTAKLWNFHTQHVLHTFQGHEQWVQSVAFAHTRNMVATGCDDKYVRVFEQDENAHSLSEGWKMTCEFGRLHDDVHAHRLGVQSVVFSPEDDFIVSGSADTSIKLWRLVDKECAHEMLGHMDWVNKVSYSPDGMMLASASYDETVKLWRISDGDEIMTFEGHEDFVNCVAWSPDGDKIVTSSGDYTVRLWQVRMPDGSLTEKAEPLRTMYGHRGWVLSVCFSPLGDKIASASSDKSVILWDAVTYQAVDRLRHRDWVEGVVFAPNRFLCDELVTIGHMVYISVWDVSTDSAKCRRKLPARPHFLQAFFLFLYGLLIQFLFGMPNRLTPEQHEHIDLVWNGLGHDDEDSVSIDEFIEAASRDKIVWKLLKRTVFDEVHLGVARARTVRVALEQHRNAGAAQLTFEELMVAFEGHKNWERTHRDPTTRKANNRKPSIAVMPSFKRTSTMSLKGFSLTNFGMRRTKADEAEGSGARPGKAGAAAVADIGRVSNKEER